MQKIYPPTSCPSCDSDLVWVNAQLYCKNSNCESKTEKRIQHFAKTLKIKGLGPVAITKLDLCDIGALYSLSVKEIANALSSERLAEKLYFEVCNSRNASLNSLLPAFSIPLIGQSAADKLAKVCDHILDINERTCLEAGIGPKATENLMYWFSTDWPLYKDLPFSFKFDKPKLNSVTTTQGVVCISGKLNSYKTKAEATKALEDKGYIVKASITKDVTILINESGIESAKTNQARSNGLLIVTNLKDFIGE